MYDEGGSTDFPGAPAPAPSFASEEPPRPGLPWESETTGRSPAAGAATVRMVLFQPGEAFRAMRLDGGLADPLLFLLLFGTVGSAFGVLWQSFMRNWTAQLGGTDFADFAFANSYGLLTLIMAPLFVLLFGCIVAAVYHLALLIFGGAPRGFDVTLRVVCYASGSTYMLMILPICGGLLATIWVLPLSIVGLREAQGVPGGRAAAAVLVPMLLLFCCCVLIWTMALGMAVAIPGMLG